MVVLGGPERGGGLDLGDDATAVLEQPAAAVLLEADEDVTIACWAAERQRDLFERAFGRELGVRA